MVQYQRFSEHQELTVDTRDIAAFLTNIALLLLNLKIYRLHIRCIYIANEMFFFFLIYNNGQ